MKKGKLLAIISAVLIVWLSAACSAPATVAPTTTVAPKTTAAPPPTTAAAPKTTAASTAWIEDIAIGSKFMPDTSYLRAVAVTKLVQKYAKKYTSHVSSYATSGAYPKAMKAGILDMSTGTLFELYEATHKLGVYKNDPPYPIQLLAPGDMAHFGIIARPGSGIKTPADLKGKRWMVRRPGSSLMDAIVNAVLYAYDLTDKDVTILSHSSTEEFQSALKEGRVDAISWPYYEGTPWLEELMAGGKAVIISDTEEAIKKMHAKWTNIARAPLPAKKYTGQTNEVITFGSPTSFTFRDGVPADQAYDITAILYDHFSEWLTLAEPQVQYFALPVAITLDRLSLPVHEGAVKYYKEKGYWTAEHEAQNKKLLAEIEALKKG